MRYRQAVEKAVAFIDTHIQEALSATDAAGESVYLLAVLATESKRIPPDMLTAEIPKAECAVFTTPPVDPTRPVSKPDDTLVDVVCHTYNVCSCEHIKKWSGTRVPLLMSKMLLR